LNGVGAGDGFWVSALGVGAETGAIEWRAVPSAAGVAEVSVAASVSGLLSASTT